MTIIPLTQDHIDNGTRMTACHCPVALAINAVMGDAAAEVIGRTINLYNSADPDAKKITVRTDSSLYHWIDNYDAGDLMQPITLRLDEKAGAITVMQPEQSE